MFSGSISNRPTAARGMTLVAHEGDGEAAWARETRSRRATAAGASITKGGSAATGATGPSTLTVLKTASLPSKSTRAPGRV